MDDPSFAETARECICSQSTRSRLYIGAFEHCGRKRKFTSPDRCRFFDNARGSALESAACLDVMVAKRFVSAGEIQAGKAMLVKIVSMLFGLIRANSDVRVFEEPVRYWAEKGHKGKGIGGNKKTNKTRSKNRNRR
jgi:four helix bundle protein